MLGAAGGLGALAVVQQGWVGSLGENSPQKTPRRTTLSISFLVKKGFFPPLLQDLARIGLSGLVVCYAASQKEIVTLLLCV